VGKSFKFLTGHFNVLKLASTSVLTETLFVELFTIFGPVIRSEIIFVAKLIVSVGKCALVSEFTGALSPVPADFGLVFGFEIIFVT